MLLKIRHKGLQDLYEAGTSKLIGESYRQACVHILDFLHSATRPEDCRGVKNFHALRGDKAGAYSMHVNGNWVITFRFQGTNVTDVDFEDYH